MSDSPQLPTLNLTWHRQPGVAPTLAPERDVAVSVLAVCTANICRSPMAEGLLRHALERRGVAAAVCSAGLQGVGQEASSYSVDALRKQGIAIDNHRSSRLTAEAIRQSDLILGMTRGHVREVVALSPDAFGRTFTLKELARRGRTLGPRQPDEELVEWLARAGRARSKRELLGADQRDDIADPIGERRDVYDRVADEIAASVGEIVELIFPVAADSISR